MKRSSTGQTSQEKDPDHFPPELLRASAGARLDYFERRCIITHRLLEEAKAATLRAICPPGEDLTTRRLGSMVTVLGPSSVGKTTMIRLLEQQLLKMYRSQMESDSTFIPFASILAPQPGTTFFDWKFYGAVLRALNDPFIGGKTARLLPRNLDEAMVTALKERKSIALIIDEAHHFAHVATGSRLQSKMNELKNLVNETGVSVILVGTYDMRPFRRINAQLACRSVDVHFPRYDATKEEDAKQFQSFLQALQRQLPVKKEPDLLAHWEFMYARSIGCLVHTHATCWE